MKKFLHLGLILAIVFMSSVALVACGKKDDATVPNGTYELTSYKTDGTERLEEGEISGTPLVAVYTVEITIDGTKFTTKNNMDATVDYAHTLDGETINISGVTSYTYKDNKIIFTSGTDVAEYTKK